MRWFYEDPMTEACAASPPPFFFLFPSFPSLHASYLPHLSCFSFLIISAISSISFRGSIRIDLPSRLPLHKVFRCDGALIWCHWQRRSPHHFRWQLCRQSIFCSITLNLCSAPFSSLRVRINVKINLSWCNSAMEFNLIEFQFANNYGVLWVLMITARTFA
jgi:hypothetical protein